MISIYHSVLLVIIMIIESKLVCLTGDLCDDDDDDDDKSK